MGTVLQEPLSAPGAVGVTRSTLASEPVAILPVWAVRQKVVIGLFIINTTLTFLEKAQP